MPSHPAVVPAHTRSAIDSASAPLGSPWRHPLVPILLLALALRIASAASPVIAHPDEIYQYLEPAHRLVTGDGIVTWEWRLGIRSWLLPALLAPAVALGGWLSPGAALLVPRMLVAIVSLTIPAAAWVIGARISRLHAVVAAVVAATWFELVFFAGRTLSEPLAVAAILPAAVLVTAPAPRHRGLAAAGALLGIAVLLRPHYTPACAVLVLVASGRRLPARLVPLAAGAIGALAIGGLVDVASGATPFAWVVANVHANIVDHRAARYGVEPALAYITWLEYLWRWWTIPIAVALRWGWRRSPALFAMALANLAVHMLIAHKEYRFVLLSGAVLVILAALGTADLVRIGQRRMPGRSLPIAAVAAWALASLALDTGPLMTIVRHTGRAGTLLFAEAARGRTCGVALYQEPTFANVPGTVALPPHVRVHLFMRADPIFARMNRATMLARGRAAYDAIVASPADARAMPPGYAPRRCETDPNGTFCLYVRPGGCADATGAPTLADAALARQSM